ncbi:hypothetical protein [Palleronia sp.]|uniref:hypothetical protein n=1 Tax=Palleronia sp. TaxID=1940284 RepID=UPI0035C82080
MARKPVIDDSIFGDAPSPDAASTPSKNPPKNTGERATLNLTITPDERWEIKEWSTRHRMKIVDVMREGFELMKKKYGE